MPRPAYTLPPRTAYVRPEVPDPHTCGTCGAPGVGTCDCDAERWRLNPCFQEGLCSGPGTCGTCDDTPCGICGGTALGPAPSPHCPYCNVY